jgi:hypothetical protein
MNGIHEGVVDVLLHGAPIPICATTATTRCRSTLPPSAGTWASCAS